MAHTYISISYHLVFSTKGRLSTIPEPQKLWAYVAGIAKNLNINPSLLAAQEITFTFWLECHRSFRPPRQCKG